MHNSYEPLHRHNKAFVGVLIVDDAGLAVNDNVLFLCLSLSRVSPSSTRPSSTMPTEDGRFDIKLKEEGRTLIVSKVLRRGVAVTQATA